MTRRPAAHRTSRTQITLRLDRDLVSTINELADDEGMDRTELARRLLSDGLTQHRLRAAAQHEHPGRRAAGNAEKRDENRNIFHGFLIINTKTRSH